MVGRKRRRVDEFRDILLETGYDPVKEVVVLGRDYFDIWVDFFSNEIEVDPVAIREFLIESRVERKLTRLKPIRHTCLECGVDFTMKGTSQHLDKVHEMHLCDYAEKHYSVTIDDIEKDPFKVAYDLYTQGYRILPSHLARLATEMRAPVGDQQEDVSVTQSSTFSFMKDNQRKIVHNDEMKSVMDKFSFVETCPGFNYNDSRWTVYADEIIHSSDVTFDYPKVMIGLTTDSAVAFFSTINEIIENHYENNGYRDIKVIPVKKKGLESNPQYIYTGITTLMPVSQKRKLKSSGWEAQVRKNLMYACGNERITPQKSFPTPYSEDDPNKRSYPYAVDFFLNDRNLVIECHGDKTHGNPRTHTATSLISSNTGIVEASRKWRKDFVRAESLVRDKCVFYEDIWQSDFESSRNKLKFIQDIISRYPIISKKLKSPKVSWVETPLTLVPKKKLEKTVETLSVPEVVVPVSRDRKVDEISSKEAASMAGVSVPTINGWVKKGIIEGEIRVSCESNKKVLFVNKKSLEKFILIRYAGAARSGEISSKEATSMAGVTATTVCAWVKKGIIEGEIRVSCESNKKVLFVNKKSLEKFLLARDAGGAKSGEITTKDAAKMTGLGISTLSEWVRTGVVEGEVRTSCEVGGRALFINKKSLESYLENRAQKKNTPRKSVVAEKVVPTQGTSDWNNAVAEFKDTIRKEDSESIDNLQNVVVNLQSEIVKFRKDLKKVAKKKNVQESLKVIEKPSLFKRFFNWLFRRN